jgi:hypothetical protein
MNADKPPQIQGIRDKKEDDLDVKHEKETLMEQVTEMDLVKPVPVDEVTELADIATKPLEETNSEAAIRIKNRITEKQQAALAKARQAKHEKRALQRLEGTDAAKGTPAPDMLVELRSKLERFEELLQDIKQKQDLVKFRGEESALQQNGMPAVQNIISPDEVQQEEKAIRPVEVPKPMPINPEPEFVRTTPAPIVRESEQLAARFKRSMTSMNYQNQDMIKRAKMDPSMGMRYQNTSTSYWF